MNVVHGNLWNYLDTHWVVIPTNLGWRQNGENVMGAGVAKVIKDSHPDVAKWYGQHCMDSRGRPSIVEYQFPYGGVQRRLIMFPTKPLNTDLPHLSWRSPASPLLIEHCAGELASFTASTDVPIAMPLVGGGLGMLPRESVMAILDRHLTSDRITLVLNDG